MLKRNVRKIKMNEYFFKTCTHCNSDLFIRKISKGCGCVTPKNHKDSAWWCDGCCKEFNMNELEKKKNE